MKTVTDATVQHIQSSGLLATVKPHAGEVPRAVYTDDPSVLTTIMPAALILTPSGRLDGTVKAFEVSVLVAVQTDGLDPVEGQSTGTQLVEDVAAWWLDHPRWTYDGDTFQIEHGNGSPQGLDVSLVVAGIDYTVVDLSVTVNWS